jgi:hypothetical protein
LLFKRRHDIAPFTLFAPFAPHPTLSKNVCHETTTCRHYHLLISGRINMAMNTLQTTLARFATTTTVWLLLSSPANAVFVTDDTGTQGTGGNQIQIDYAFNKSTNAITDEDGIFIEDQLGSSNAYLLTYTRGISENIDIFVGAARQAGSVSGWQSTGIGLKWVFAGDQTQGWSAAIKPIIILPTSQNMQNNGLGPAKTNVNVTLISSYLSDTYEWHFNASYASNRQVMNADTEAERQNIWSVSVSPVLVLNPQWKVGLDVGFQNNPGFNSKTSAYGELGFLYSPIENLQLGLGVIYAADLNAKNKAYSYTLTTGLTYQF